MKRLPVHTAGGLRRRDPPHHIQMDDVLRPEVRESAPRTLRHMIGAEDRMPDLAEMELYCAEARDIIARAEETVYRLARNGACEGHRMMAGQGLAALRNLSRIIERHRNRMAVEILPPVVSQTGPQRRSWLPFVRPRGAGAVPVLATRG